jgi:hypothetical protein
MGTASTKEAKQEKYLFLPRETGISIRQDKVKNALVLTSVGPSF